MTYILDTNIVIPVLKGRAWANSLLATFAPRQLVISLVTYAEIYEGIYYSNNPQQAQRTFRAFLHGVRVIRLNKPIMQQFARLRGQLRRAGMMIGDMDTLIAATALYYDLTVVTTNVQHFQRIPNLTLLPIIRPKI